MTEPQIPPSAPQAIEQFEVHAENMAAMIAVYYKKYVSLGVPPDVARQLALDFHNIVWTKMLYMKGDEE